MAKPPTSTRTVRLTDELWATIKADAEARGEAVNAVIARHLRIAYAPKKLTVECIMDETLASPLGARAMAKLKRVPPSPRFWPSGALIEPHHTEDPAPKLTLGSSVTFGPRPSVAGSRLKVKK